MPYRSNLPQVTAKMRAARGQGLIAAAHVVMNRVRQGLVGGYTSGAFVTQNWPFQSVTRSEPEEDARGALILVGTDKDVFPENGNYALFWELGHMNLFTRKFERKEVWVPALFSTRADQLAAFQRAYQSALGAT